MEFATKNGFTLVELSIVIVIVGLIIGGILVGQSLMDSAKVNSEAQKISQWSIAIINFKEKFKQYPGDSNLFPNAGNNDGDTNDNIGACNATRVVESYSAWSHLSQSQMLGGKQYVWTPANYCAVPKIYTGMLPRPSFKYYDGVSDLFTESQLNIRRVGYPYAGKRYQYTISNHYKFYDLLALEKKLDDGVTSFGTGSILSYTYSEGADCDTAGAQAEDAAVTQISSVKDVICYAVFYLNDVITQN